MFHTLTFKRMNVILQIEQKEKLFPGDAREMDSSIPRKRFRGICRY